MHVPSPDSFYLYLSRKRILFVSLVETLCKDGVSLVDGRNVHARKTGMSSGQLEIGAQFCEDGSLVFAWGYGRQTI